MINKTVMLTLRKKLQITDDAIYKRIRKIQDECLCAREDAANLLAYEEGIPVYKFLTESELKRLRELQKTRKTSQRKPVTVQQKEKNEKPKMNEIPITPNKLYDLLKFHPRIVRASRSLFRTKHYPEAILNAFKCIEILTKKKSGIKGIGANLMHMVFNEKKPIIKLNQMQQDFEIDEQMGFRFIYAGSMTGIRNPKAHAEVPQKDPYRTLEYLSLASLLAKRLDEGVKVN